MFYDQTSKNWPIVSCCFLSGLFQREEVGNGAPPLFIAYIVSWWPVATTWIHCQYCKYFKRLPSNILNKILFNSCALQYITMFSYYCMSSIDVVLDDLPHIMPFVTSWISLVTLFRFHRCKLPKRLISLIPIFFKHSVLACDIDNTLRGLIGW